MKRGITLLALALIAFGVTACKRPAPPADDTVASVAAAPAVDADAWPGRYEGDVMVRINGSAGARRVVLIAAAKDGCSGDIGLNDNGATARDISDQEVDVVTKPDPQTTCTIKLRRDGDMVTVSEDQGCAAYHGATCSFNGKAMRVK